MAAAGQITVTTYGYNNATAYVQMKSGYGNIRTQTINISPVYKKGQDSVTVNTFTTTDTYITFNASNKTLNNFIIHYALSNRVSDHTSFPIPAEKAYNAGYYAAAATVRPVGSTNAHVYLSPGGSTIITVPTTSGGTRTITVHAPNESQY